MVDGCSWMTCPKWSDVGLQRRGLGSKSPESAAFSDTRELAMDCFCADNTALLHSNPVFAECACYWDDHQGWDVRFAWPG